MPLDGPGIWGHKDQSLHQCGRQYNDPLRRFVLCVNLTAVSDARIGGKTLLLDVSVRVFSEEISI